MKTQKSPMKSGPLQVHAQLPQILHQVVRERIVVVQNKDHLVPDKLIQAGENESFKKPCPHFATGAGTTAAFGLRTFKSKFCSRSAAVTVDFTPSAGTSTLAAHRIP